MNRLFVGTKKSDIIKYLPAKYLFIDDGNLIDAIPLPKRRKITRLDFSKHSFNPLKHIDYKRACDFVSVLDAVFPEGENTLTKKSASLVLLTALLSGTRYLDKLIPPPSLKDTGAVDAYQKVQRLLLSPVLKRFLCNPTNFPLDGIILARLDRRVLSDFDCFVIANLLISAYPGHVVIPDFGFYSCAFHTALIRQNRLIAGVNFLDETPLRNDLLLIEEKLARSCTADDAEVLASYAGIVRGTNAHTDFVQKSIA